MKKALVKTYGCQMNAYDSTRIQELLGGQGYGVATSPEDADLVVLNTCHIREKASEKIFSELGKLRVLKAQKQDAGGEMLLAVAGCVAQAEGEEIVRRERSVDLVLGPQSYHRLPEMLRQRESTRRAVLATDFEGDAKFAARKPAAQGVSAFLTVQEGCDKFCSFCVVPYTRGAEYSRPVADVLAEAQALVASGVRELTLLGQNVNAYRGLDLDGLPSSLARLTWALAKFEGLERIRYVTSHPRDMSDDLIEAHAENEKLMPYLHLPIQAGSDRILKAMNRGHKADDYIRLIERLRQARPDLALSGDFIVGFPGETEREFEATLDVVREVGYASAFSFKYSARPGTPAAERKDQVPEEEKADRLARLQKLLVQQQQAFNEACVGNVLPVLVEKPGRNPGQMVGRSPYLQSVNATLPASSKGQILDLQITGVGPNSLSGQYVPTPTNLHAAEGVPAL